MANYIPPHKRQLKDGAKALEGLSLNSHSLVHKFQQKLNLSGSFHSESCSSERGIRRRYLYPKSCLSRLYIVDYTKEEEHQYPGSIRLNHISSKSILYDKVGRTPYILVSSYKKTGINKLKLKKNSSIENPLISVAEQILPNLLAFQSKRVEGSSKEFKEGEIRLVARFGQILFHGPSLNMDTLRDKSELEASLSGIRRSFNTHIPKSFPESVLNVVVPEIGVELEEEKEYYYVRVTDKSCLDVSFTCKCTETGAGGLELRKIETNHVRHMIVDIACVEKDLDLRFMLSTRNTVPESTDEEKHGLEKLIKSAVVDPTEKGGLRFPLGYESFEGRYRVVGIGHTTMRAFKNSSIKIKFTKSDRYEFITSTTEVTNHVVLIMNGISEKLKENNLDTHQLAKMLEDNMKLIWDYFLRLECCFS